MSESRCPMASRRNFLGASAGLIAAAGAARGANAATGTPAAEPSSLPKAEPFFGAHQGGITTRQQTYTYFATFDLAAETRADVRTLLRNWTEAAARMAAGQSADPNDSGEQTGLAPARLTITFGFGPGLFSKDGHDRYGLAAKRPAALADLPIFIGDQLQPARTGGDVSIQACADDPQVAFHAVRQLGRIAYGAASMRWAQAGFMPAAAGRTPRNLMGFKDGSNNPNPANATDMQQVVWAGNEGPDWMNGGTYLVARRIRIALEHWDRTAVSFQEQTIGRTKSEGAPIGGHAETDLANLSATDADGNSVIADTAHVRMASAVTTGARIFRRGYSYNDGLSFTAERWPPWRQAMEYDAGLLFMAYQKDPRTQFSKIFEKMAKLDMLNQFVTHTGSGLFAVPGGVSPGQFIGEALLA